MRSDVRPRKHDWRAELTADEAREIAEIDNEAKLIDSRRRELTAKRSLIVNRALKRATFRGAA
jgi:hypothetical protein